MEYRLILSARAVADLARVPPDLRDFVQRHLSLLGRYPTVLSRPSAPPYPEGCQMDVFNARRDGVVIRTFVVLFRYGQDEETLWVLGIGHTPLAPPQAE
jgi:hypothetical protein